MATFIDIEDIDTMNLRIFHELIITQFNIIQFLQHLQLLPTKTKDTGSCNKKCNDWYLTYVEKRGDEGPGHIVEIDESCFGKRKYQSGRLLKSQWVFDGIDINTKKCFMVPVQQCDAVTLLPILTTYVLPGTTIHSDECRAYHALQHNPAYQYATVNYSVSFVDPKYREYLDVGEKKAKKSKVDSVERCLIHI
ncbi:unnamed protein product [Rotaria socialis]